MENIISEKGFDVLINLLTGVLLPAVVACVTIILSRRIEKGKNIVSIITNARIERYNMLKECSAQLLSNTAPKLFELSEEKEQEMHIKAYHASCKIGVILHRNVKEDEKLINHADEISCKAILLSKNELNTEEKEQIFAELTKLRNIFKIEMDIYLNTEWYRIKKEAKGKETKTVYWYKINSEIREKYSDVINEYEKEG